MAELGSITSFINNSKGLARNPLGIIALFISLIYGFACLVLGFSGDNLENNERLILIIFLVGFPLLILISFLFLVTKHYRKLYAPSDFKDERNYLETIDILTQKSRIQDQINIAITPQTNKTEGIKSLEKQSEKNKTLSSYLIVENLVLRLVEKEYNLPLRRNVKFKNHENTFDCVIESQDMVIAVEIKYYENILETHTETIALHLKRRFHSFQRITSEYYPNLNRRFILYVVHDQTISNLIEEITKSFRNEREAEIRFYEYKTLLNQFGF